MRGPFSSVSPDKTPVSQTNLEPHSWLVNKSFHYTSGLKNEESSPKHYSIQPVLTTPESLTRFCRFNSNKGFCYSSVENKPAPKIFYKDFVFDNHKDTKLFEFYSIPNFYIPRYILAFLYNSLSLKGHIPRSLSLPCCDEVPVKSGNFLPLNKRYYLYLNDDCTTRKFDGRCSNSEIQLSSLFIPITPPYSGTEDQDGSSLLCQELLNDSRKITEFFKLFPNNIAFWLQHDNSTILRIDRIPPNISTSYSAFDFEVCLKLLEFTLSRHPKNISFISKFMSLYSYKNDYQQVIYRWKHFLFIVVQSSRLWNEYINYISQSYEHFYFEGVVQIYNIAFGRLISILEGNLLSNTPEINAEYNLVFLMIKFCYFLKNAGYQERALSSIIALIEINVIYRLSAPNKSNFVDKFTTNWNANSSVIFNIVNIHPYLTLSLFEKPIIHKDRNRKVDDIIFIGKSWTDAEHIRSETWSFQPQFQYNEGDIIDSKQLIHHSQLTPYLFSISKGENLFQLLLHTLIMFGIPISLTSRVNNTFLSELGMVVEIDAIGWLSLSPLHFTGTLLVNSTDTKNFVYVKFPLTNQQITSVINLLNHTLPTMDIEYQTVILITWFEYEINCLVYNVYDKEFNMFVRDQIKSILARDIHKNNLELWSAYVILNSYVSTLEEVFKIPTNILSHYTNSDSLFERLLCLLILLSICPIVETRFSLDMSGLKLYFMKCLASDCFPKYDIVLEYLGPSSNIPTYCSSESLRIKQTIWMCLLSSFENSSSIGNPIIPMLYSFFFLQTEIIMMKPLELEAYCLNLKIIRDYVSCSNIFPTEQSKNRIMQCIVYKAIILIVKYIGLGIIPYYLANIINNFLLPCMSYNTCLYNILMRSYKSFNTNLLFYANATISGYIGLLVRLLNLFAQELDFSLKLNLSNMLRGTFEDALKMYPFNLILCVAYLDFLNLLGITDDIRSFFLQAIRKTPGAKHLYMQFLSTLSKDINFALSIMEDKGIRLFCPMEEYFLLQNTDDDHS